MRQALIDLLLSKAFISLRDVILKSLSALEISASSICFFHGMKLMALIIHPEGSSPR